MNEELKKQLEKYRETAMLYWHVAGDDENAEDLGTRSYENLLLECTLMATIMMKENIREYKEESRRKEDGKNKIQK